MALAQRSREELAQRGRYSLTVAVLFILVLLGAGLPLPQRAIAVVPLLVAAVESVRELRRLRRVDAPGVNRLGPVVTLGFVGLLLLAAVTQAALYGPQKAYEDCMAGAITQAAQAACTQQRQQYILGNIMRL